ncbi:MAG: pesticidal protein Cry15Aa [Chloroflexi bacterium]|nr:pesticidal protein Cry15Aa [Chloroflexota bacterium]
MRTIKRYPNRKLYDTERKRYVTLDEIATMIQEGLDVQVVDHESGADLTSITLAQIIFEREKKRSGFLPQSILTSLVRTGGGTMDYLRRSLQTSVKALRMLEEEIDSRIDSLVAKGELAQEEAERLRKELHENASAIARDIMPDLRIESALERLNLPTGKDVEALQKQVEQLTEQVELLLQHTQATDASAPQRSDEISSPSDQDSASA